MYLSRRRKRPVFRQGFKERKVKRIMFNKNDKKMRTVSIVIVVLICASMVIGTAAAGLSAFLH